jgi:hypothetical protein
MNQNIDPEKIKEAMCDCITRQCGTCKHRDDPNHSCHNLPIMINAYECIDELRQKCHALEKQVQELHVTQPINEVMCAPNVVNLLPLLNLMAQSQYVRLHLEGEEICGDSFLLSHYMSNALATANVRGISSEDSVINVWLMS